MIAEVDAVAYHLDMFNKNLIKIIKAIDLLAGSGGTTVEALERELDLGRRSVFRLLDTLENELGFPIIRSREEFGGVTTYTLMDRFVTKLSNVSLPKLDLSLQEATLLYFLLSRDAVFAGSEVEEDLSSIRAKLRILLPAKLSGSATDAELESLFAVSTNAVKSYAGKEHLLDTIFDAVKARQSCRLLYRAASSEQPKSYEIHPLQLVDHRGGLYLFIRIPKHDSIRIVAVDRIESIELLATTFEYPADFNAESLLASAFDLTFGDPITAAFRFSPKAARYATERQYGGERSIETNSDGSITMTLATSGQEDLLRWIIGFGPDAEILSPPAFREEARSRLSATLARYGDAR